MSIRIAEFLDLACVIFLCTELAFLVGVHIYHWAKSNDILPEDSIFPWTRKGLILTQAQAIARIPSNYSECATDAIISLIQKHYTYEDVAINNMFKNQLFKEAMGDLTSSELTIHITKIVAMKCMNGGKVPAAWREKCLKLGMGEHVTKEMQFLERGWCVCHPESSDIRLWGCPDSRYDQEKWSKVLHKEAKKARRVSFRDQFGNF